MIEKRHDNVPTASFWVNGRQVEGSSDKKLLDFLREDLRLTAAKNGCGSGACGACTVLADGKPIRSCVTVLGKVIGKRIVTVEGLTPQEQEVYSFAFAEAGAVQSFTHSAFFGRTRGILTVILLCKMPSTGGPRHGNWGWGRATNASAAGVSHQNPSATNHHDAAPQSRGYFPCRGDACVALVAMTRPTSPLL